MLPDVIIMITQYNNSYLLSFISVPIMLDEAIGILEERQVGLYCFGFTENGSGYKLKHLLQHVWYQTATNTFSYKPLKIKEL